MIKVIAFDCFGTVFDMSGVRREELVDYANHIRKPLWSPLHLPKSWEYMPAHPDASYGLAMLREKFLVVTCSNGPLGLLARLSKNASIEWDAIIPLEMNRVFKPDLLAYLTVCQVLDVDASEVMMVTANKTFGDLEASAKLGMTPQLIRGDSDIQTIDELARSLGAGYY